MKLKNYSDYEIYPETGEIWSYKRNMFIKGRKNTKGYIRIVLIDDNGIKKDMPLHRVIAMAAIPNPDNLPEVNHKDEDKTNNKVSNLEWCTHEYNVNFGTRNARAGEALTNGKQSRPVLGFKENKIMKYFPSVMEAERCGFSCGHISSCCNGERKTHGGYDWKYLEDYLGDLLEEIQDEDMAEEEKEKAA